MKKLVIDPGHGGHDPGAVFKGLCEKDINLQVATKVWSILMGIYDLKLTRTVDKFVGLTERCVIANDFHADFFLSLHCNADPDSDLPDMPEAHGEEIWYYRGSEKGKQYAEVLRSHVDALFPDEPFRGVKPTRGFTVLGKKNYAPANLIEMGFIDNSATWRSFKDPKVIAEIAMTLSLGIMRAL